MRHTPRYLMTDPDEVKRLIRNNPWATFVSPSSQGLTASHYPAILDEEEDGIVIVSHFGRPDEKLHELGEHEILVIIQGPHDYVSPSWYAPGDLVPTWNHVTAHLYGTPEILSDEENGGDFGAKFLVEQHPELFTGIRHALGEAGGISRVIAGKRFYPIQLGEKQICWLKATVRGAGGHGAMIHREAR